MAKIPLTNERLAIWLSIVITGLWAVSFFVDIFVKSYDPPPTVHGLMMVVAGTVLGEGIIRKRAGEETKKGAGTDE